MLPGHHFSRKSLGLGHRLLIPSYSPHSSTGQCSWQSRKRKKKKLPESLVTMESWWMTCGTGSEKGMGLLVPRRMDGSGGEGRVPALQGKAREDGTFRIKEQES